MAKLSSILRSGVAAMCIAATLAPAGSLAQSERLAPQTDPLQIRVGQAAQFSRIEFQWAGGARAASRREGQVLTLRFSRSATPDLSMLRTFPPKFLKAVEARKTGGGLEIALTLAEGADAKVGQSDGLTYVNLFEAKPAEAAAVATGAAAQAAAPEIGSVKVTPRIDASQARLDFEWPETVGAAVFRRGDTVWAVFDARANLDLSALPKVSPQFTGIEAIKGPSWTALRIRSGAATPVAASGQGSRWTITLGQGPQAERALVTVARDREADQPALTAALAGATRAITINDPETGAFTVVTALAPSKGLDARRRYADLEFLPSAQGLVIAPLRTDLTVGVEGDIIRIGRPNGLALSSPTAITGAIALPDGPQPAAYPALIDFAGWSRLGSDGFYHRYDALMSAASAETLADEASTGEPQVQARMALARFLVGTQLSHEAIGILNLLAEAYPQMLSDPEFRGLRGAARTMAGRYEEASVDLSSPALAGDPSAALWRGYLASKSEQWTDARRAFAQGYAALSLNSPDWKSRFARADAEAAINTGELEVAKSQLQFAERVGASDEDNLATSLMRGRLFEAEGSKDRALEIYALVAAAPVDRPDLATEATLYATKIKLAQGKLQPMQAADILDGLRFRWRGDAVELKTIRALGDIYLGLGRYREALEALRSASEFAGSSAEGVSLQNDLSGAFRALFLDGKADGLQPIQAVALFYDFIGLVPPGADGDRMVRLMARRLVDLDLFDQAEALLSYQAENRLEGAAKAEVATDLAEIRLMDRRPEEALNAINDSRITALPNALNSRRRLISGRALMELGRFDAAVEMIEAERTPEAEDLRADIAWKRRDWAAAGPVYERRLGERWKSDAALTPDEAARLLRTAVSFSLAGDDVSLARVRAHYEKYVAASPIADSLRIAFAGNDIAELAPSDLRRVMAQGETFAGWVTRSKQKFRERAGPVSRQAKATPAAPVPAARPPAPAAKG